MEANELRIGNYIYDVHNRVSNIVTIGNGTIRLSSKNYHYDSFNTSDISPIPLTEDILLKCGFTKGDYHTNWFSHIELNCHLVQFSDGEYVLEGVDDIRLSEGFRYVHQLQNIYFALANEELKMNL